MLLVAVIGLWTLVYGRSGRRVLAVVWLLRLRFVFSASKQNDGVDHVDGDCADTAAGACTPSKV